MSECEWKLTLTYGGIVKAVEVVLIMLLIAGSKNQIRMQKGLYFSLVAILSILIFVNLFVGGYFALLMPFAMCN